MFYTNKSIELEVNSSIIEYDIKSADVSICTEYNLLPSKTIEKIRSMDKKARNIYIGKIRREDRKLNKQMEEIFNVVVDEFMLSNKLDKEKDVISIKKDAVFVLNKPIKFNTIGSNIHFINKNEYHAYLYLRPYEFYFKKDDVIDVKGINDDLLKKHKDGVLYILNEFIDCAESSNYNIRELNLFVKELVQLYKERKLPIDVYREFNNTSMYKSNMNGSEIYLDIVDDDMINDIDILYNYINIILPLWKVI